MTYKQKKESSPTANQGQWISMKQYIVIYKRGIMLKRNVLAGGVEIDIRLLK